MTKNKENVIKERQIMEKSRELSVAFSQSIALDSSGVKEKQWRYLNTMDALRQSASASLLIIDGIFFKNCVTFYSNKKSTLHVSKNKIVLNLVNHLINKILLINELLDANTTKSPEFEKFIDGLKIYKSKAEKKEKTSTFYNLFFDSIGCLLENVSVLMKTNQNQVISSLIKRARLTNGNLGVGFSEDDFFFFLDELLECFIGQPEIKGIGSEFDRLCNNKTAKYMFFFNPKSLAITTKEQLNDYIKWFLSTALGKSEVDFGNSDEKGMFFKSKSSKTELANEVPGSCFKLNSDLESCTDTKKVKQFLKKEGLNFGEKVKYFNSAFLRIKDTPIVSSVVYIMSYLAFIFEDKELESCVQALAPGFSWHKHKLSKNEVLCIEEISKRTSLGNFFVNLNEDEFNPVLSFLGKYVNLFCLNGCAKKSILAHQIHKFEQCFESGQHLSLSTSVRTEMIFKFIFDRQLQVAQYLINKEQEIDYASEKDSNFVGQAIGVKQILSSSVELMSKDLSGFVGHRFIFSKPHPEKKEQKTFMQWLDSVENTIPRARGGAVLAIEAPSTQINNNIYLKKWGANVEAALMQSEMSSNLNKASSQEVPSLEHEPLSDKNRRKNRL